MNFGQAKAKLRKDIGSPSTTSVPDSDLGDAVNEGYSHIADRFNFFATRCLATFPTVAGTKRYALPSDILSIIRVWDETNRRNIGPAGLLDFTRTTASVARGLPMRYIHLRNWLELDPTPTGVYTIGLYFRSAPAPLVDAADEPIFPRPWDSGWTRYNRYVHFNNTRQWADAAASYNDWALWLESKPDEMSDEIANQPLDTFVPTLAARIGMNRYAWNSIDGRYDTFTGAPL